HLLLNTVCAQVTAFSDPMMVPRDAPVTEGPDLFRWARAQGRQVSRSGEAPRPVRFDDHLPRAWLGEYLAWSFTRMAQGAPPTVRIEHIRATAVSVLPRGDRAEVVLDDGTRLESDLAVVATGHGLPADERPDGPRRPAYPLPDVLADVPAGATVAVLGTGLSAMDVVAAATLGRGGRYTGEGAGRRYLPSGEEPRLVLASRSGWWAAARPALPPGRRPLPPVHLTRQALAAARARNPDGRLDVQADLWPLIRAEMRHRAGLTGVPADVARLDPLLDGVSPWFEDAGQYRTSVLARSRADLVEAELGLGRSGVKEALEVLRDHRHVLRAVVEDDGLSEEGRRWFFGPFVATVNRLAIGPQRERIAELLLLEKAGMVTLAPGPNPLVERVGDRWRLSSTRLRRPAVQEADLLVDAHLHWPPPAERDQQLWRRLAAVARTRDGRVALDADGRPTALDGTPMRGVLVVGPPAEGSSYYNHYVPSPGATCQARATIDRILAPLLGEVTRVPTGAPRRSSPPRGRRPPDRSEHPGPGADMNQTPTVETSPRPFRAPRS
ncbi:MAG TPA: FAD/NAD(P)-binding protein, partial [Kineosporiaceae bacterium]